MLIVTYVNFLSRCDSRPAEECNSKIKRLNIHTQHDEYQHLHYLYKVKLNQNTYINEEKSPSQYPRYIKHINYMKYQQK